MCSSNRVMFSQVRTLTTCWKLHRPRKSPYAWMGIQTRYTYEMTRHNHLAKNLSSPASTAHSFDFQYGDGFGNLAYRELSNAYSQIDMLRIREENAFRRIIYIYAKLRKMKAMR